MRPKSAIAIAATEAAGPFAGNGEMAALMRDTDWSKTGLGPVDTWPNSLKTMLGVMLGSRFPMLLWWGPDLLHLYNDAYRPILREKHPGALGGPAAQWWAEVWEVAGPMARSVQAGGPATWTEDLQLFITNGAMAEETYFTFSYSPVPGDDGRVGGVLNTVQESTVKVRGERQIRMLGELTARAAEADSEREAQAIAMEVLAANPLDIPFVLFYTLEDRGGEAQLVAAGGWPDYTGPAKPASQPIEIGHGANAWPFDELLDGAREVVVDDLAERFGMLPIGQWNTRPERAILLPLTHTGHTRPFACLVMGLSPHRAFDERYRQFYRATADQVRTAIDNACAYQLERERVAKLLELDRSKNVFFSNISHEFRTPLTLLLGPLETLLAQPGSAQAREPLLQMQRNALRMLRLVNTLLDFARMDAGRHSARFAATDLARYTTDLASAFRSAMEKAGLDFSVRCTALPEPIYVDREMWEKIVMNLLSNALKFTLAGSVRVSLVPTQAGASLIVRDSGTGIPASELPRIFQRFHRVEGARARTLEGTGIGLALVRELVQMHGGEIGITSEEGKGTVITVSLRTGQSHLAAEHIVEVPDAGGMTRSFSAHLDDAMQWLTHDSAPPPIPGTKRTAHVLVVDDNSDLRSFLVRMLTPHFEVRAVADGREALRAIEERRPDLVLSDVMMPNLDGLGLVRALREAAVTRTLPIILLSARAGQEASLKGLAAGADDYLAKPFTSGELLARVRTHLNMARTRNELNAELLRANEELKSFSYSVSHDLQAPLRAIDGYSAILLEECASQLDAKGHEYLNTVRASAVRMGELISDLLQLASVGNAGLVRQPVDLSALARAVGEELQRAETGRKVEVQVEEGLAANADVRLLRIVLENLLGNACKFTRGVMAARVSLERLPGEAESAFVVRDNGAGFEMRYVDKLFKPFQRLHGESEFPGTGIGLATVRRIVERHGGRVWAESVPRQGASLYFTLPSPVSEEIS
jgi:signal transduction histidine kinase